MQDERPMAEGWPTMGSAGQHFATLFGQTDDPAFLVESLTGRIVACNEAGARHFGYVCDEIVGLDIGRDFSANGLDYEKEGITAQLIAGKTARFVERKRRKNGDLFWDEVVLFPYRTGESPIHISMNRDITERIHREESLRESEARYRSIFESTTDAVLVFDHKTQVVEANPNAYRMYGYEEGELIGVSAEALIHPDYFHGFSNFRRAIDDAGYFISRSVNLRKNGTPMDVEVHGGRFVFNGSPHLLSVVRDIRAQVEAETKLEASRQKLELLHGVARRLEACEEEDELYHIAVDAAQAILDLPLCSLDIREGDRLVVKAMSKGLTPEDSVGTSLDEDTLATRTLRDGTTTVFGDPSEVSGIRPTSDRFRSGISTPVGDFGVFQAASEQGNAFSSEDVRLLELIIGHTVEAIRRVRLQAELVRKANHDPLTGLYNRRYFNQVIETELSRSERYEHALSFLMIDVNRFKEINDTFGHQTGDEVLQSVSGLLRQAVRETDLVVRYGGDEFLVVLLETLDETDSIIQRIDAAMNEKNRTNSTIPFPVTLAIGSARWKPSSSETLEAVLARADKLMYEAKKGMGR